MNKHFGARDAWTERARAVPIEHEIDRRGIKLRGTIEREGPCPKCGGTDRFSINTKKQCWNCRGCNAGGDVIALVQHLDGVDFLGACTVLAGDFTSAGPHRKAADERKIVAEEYRYEDEAGELSFVVKRMEYQLPDGTFAAKNGKKKKTFAQCRPEPTNPNKWIWNVEGLRPLLYRLPAVLEAVADERPILIVEGERKVDLLASVECASDVQRRGCQEVEG
jgi:CHC2 zinc finger